MLPPLNSNNEAGITQILCACGTGPIEMKTLACCRRCYDRRHHSLRFFSGMREHVLERDRFRCRACGQQRRLLVHHRDPGNEPKLLVTSKLVADVLVDGPGDADAAPAPCPCFPIYST